MTPVKPPTFLIVDADILAPREKFLLAENLGGRSVLNSTSDTLYSISDSGVTVFPVGRNLRNARRVAASPRDDDIVSITDAARNERVQFRLDASLDGRQGHWSNYPMTVAVRVGTELFRKLAWRRHRSRG